MYTEKKRDAGLGWSALYCRVTTSLCRESLLCNCAAGFATADGNKTKMADGGERGGGAVTHGLKYSTGKGGCEHAAQPRAQLIGCGAEANAH